MDFQKTSFPSFIIERVIPTCTVSFAGMGKISVVELANEISPWLVFPNMKDNTIENESMKSRIIWSYH